MLTEKWTPFPGLLEDVGHFNKGHINYLSSEPEKIVRIENVGHFSRNDYLLAKALFEELRTDYGVNIPNTQYVRGYYSDAQPNVIYSVVERVHGVVLFSPDFNDLGAATSKEFDRLCASLARYYIDKVGTDEPHLCSWYSADFMYGRRKQDDEYDFFLVDTDPRIGIGHPEIILRDVCSIASRYELVHSVRLDKTHEEAAKLRDQSQISHIRGFGKWH